MATQGEEIKNFLALASWCATTGEMRKMEWLFSG
jgi:hypothetical protein